MHNIHYWDYPENVKHEKVYAEIVEIAAEDGDGYSGCIKWHGEIAPLESRDAAEKKIRQLDKGWYDDHAVRYYDYRKAKETKAIETLERRIKETQEKYKKYSEEHSALKVKAELIGCSCCGSKLAKSHLHSEFCPVCREDLRSMTTLKTLKGYKDKIAELQQRIEDEKKKQTAIRETRWLVKFEYHS